MRLCDTCEATSPTTVRGNVAVMTECDDCGRYAVVHEQRPAPEPEPEPKRGRRGRSSASA